MVAAIPRWAVPTGELQLGLTQSKQQACLNSFKLQALPSPLSFCIDLPSSPQDYTGMWHTLQLPWGV